MKNALCDQMVIRAFFAFAGNDVERFLILNKAVGKISGAPKLVGVEALK